MKIYIQSFINAFFLSLIGALPLVAVYLFHTLPEIKDTSFRYKNESTSIAVQSVFEVLNYFHNKEKSGELSQQEAQQSAIDLIKTLRYSGKEYFWINDMTPKMIMHPFKPELNGKDVSQMADPNGKKLFIEMVNVVKKDKKGYVEYEWAKPNSDKPVPKVSYVQQFEPWGWIIGSGVYVDNVMTEVANMQSVSLKYFGLGFLFLVAMGCFSGYRQIKKWVIPVQNVLSGLQSQSEQLYTDSVEIKKASQELSDHVSQQAAAIEETVASMEEMSAMLNKTSEQTIVNLQGAEEGTEKGQETYQKVQVLNIAMSEVEKSNTNLDTIIQTINQIKDKTKVINNIVFETRLLSFNASIEAARAGVHGRGFSVVSEEIGKLALMSGNAALEIGQLLDQSQQQITNIINDIQIKVQDGQRVSKSFSGDVEGIAHVLSKMKEATEEVSRATKEQHIGIRQTNEAMNSMEKITQFNSQNSEKLAGQAQQLLSRSESLKEAIEQLYQIVA